MINQKLVAVALKDVDTTNFERFAQTFYGAMQDREFIPLGGMHDGGAEGYDTPALGPEVFEDETKHNFLLADSFLQVSKQETTNKKIRDTVARLKEYGRSPKVLTYITSQSVKDTDKLEGKLSKELGLKIAIRDAGYIETYINYSGMTQGAFESYLAPSIQHLMSPGASEVATEVKSQSDRTLAVFLRQEADSRKSRSSLLTSVSDSLIIWALRDTDPDAAKFMKRDEILAVIESALPTTKQFIRSEIDKRLAALTAKDAPNGRQIRHYRKSQQYCLPFETRKLVAVENADDDLLKFRVSCVLEDRLAAKTTDDIDKIRSVIIDCCHRSLEQVFAHQGLKVAQFVTNADVDDEPFTDVAEIVMKVVNDTKLSAEKRSTIRRLSLAVLRGTFYFSSEVERRYLLKLSRTYVLLLLLKNEPKIVEYFNSMAGSFNLYIGSDIIVRALSELYLSEESQATINLLKILNKSGSKLILTEKTVEEVATHIRRQMYEFNNVYARNESRIAVETIEYIDRLLIRSYFYARLAPVGGITPPKSWAGYLGQFCDPGDVYRNQGDKELATYLLQRFSMVYEDTETMSDGIDQAELDDLTSSIQAARNKGWGEKEGDNVLAYNDALQVLRIYAARKVGKEAAPGNPFGFKTWWLTQDGKVRRASKGTVAKNGGKVFMMRPEFLLNYIGLSPALSEVVKSYETIFPSSLGVRLASGIGDADFNKVMRDASALSGVDDARADAMVAAITEKLQGNVNKDFGVHW